MNGWHSHAIYDPSTPRVHRPECLNLSTQQEERGANWNTLTGEHALDLQPLFQQTQKQITFKKIMIATMIKFDSLRSLSNEVYSVAWFYKQTGNSVHVKQIQLVLTSADSDIACRPAAHDPN